MKRFILLSFGFLGWAFYEMSGGADFEPASVRMAHLIPVTETELAAADDSTDQNDETIIVADAPKPFVDTDPPQNNEVTRVSLNLTTLENALAETAPVTELADQLADQEDTGVPVNVGVTLASADTPAIIPSLIAPDDTGAAVQQTSLITSTATDLRTVSANRVNVRGGPGTDYGVVTKLVRGSEVEVIQDNGDGWVKMRPVDGGPEGWMADFLLADG